MSNSFDVVDFHSHILPGADHGSLNLETSLYQIAEAKKNGINRIIATSHFYPTAHSVESFLSRRDEAYRLLACAMPSDSPAIRLGAEVLICDGIEDLPGLERLFIKGTNTILLELPFSEFTEKYCDSVYTLRSRNVNVVIAHADRYSTEVIDMMLDVGAKLQLNSGSLLTFFKRRTLYDWLDRGMVIALGSDIHGKDRNAYPGFVKAMSRIEKYLEYIKEKSDNIFSKSSPFEL